jgi:hypothetical protein
MSDDSDLVIISRKGRRAARRLGGVHALVAELALRIGPTTSKHLESLGEQLLEHYGGDADKAVAALRKGEVVLEKLS